MNPMLSEREKEIVEILSQDINLSVADLSRKLNVSTVTIRNDLSSLAEKGMVHRTRGGAIPAFSPSVIRRQKSHPEAKQRIARAAADLIREADTVMIEAGTTTALVAQHLLGKRDVQLVTNSTLVLPFVRVNPALRLTLVGGEFRPATESFVGPLALSALDRFHVRLAFVGTDGFTTDGGLTTNLLEGAEIVRKMAERAAHTILVADSSKFGRRGFVHVLPLTGVGTLITDEGLADQAREELNGAGIEIIFA